MDFIVQHLIFIIVVLTLIYLIIRELLCLFFPLDCINKDSYTDQESDKDYYDRTWEHR